MKTLKFNTAINAPKEKVWNILWGKDTYPQWTVVFSEDSNVKTDWKEGSDVFFTDGTDNGMYAIIKKKDDYKQMTFQHQGMLKDGVKETADSSWAGATEDYQLNESNGKTNLAVSVDVTEDHVDSFQKIFPKALDIVKNLSEQS